MAPNRKKKSSKSTKAPKALNPEVLPAEAVSESEESQHVEKGEDEDEFDSENEPSSTELAAAGEAPAELPEDLSDRDVQAISPTDPLRRYMEEVRRYPLLDPEEEFRLAVRLRDEGDVEAAKRLVQANLRLVIKIALEYRNLYSNLLDLIQEGNVGLMKAVSKYDPTKGARVGYYSSWWIRSYILKYILDNFRLVKIGTTQAQKKLFYHLMREKQRLEAQGIYAGPRLLAERLDVKEKEVREMELRLSGQGAEMPLDAPINSDSSQPATYLSQLPDEAETVEETFAREELLRLLEGKIPEFQRGLDDREKRILNERLLAEEPKTLQEIADNYGLTRERARQIEAKVIQKFREFLKSDLDQT